LQKRIDLHKQQATAAAAMPPVFLTYCDAAFQPIFEVFHACFQAAMGSDMVSHLLDLGATDTGGCVPAPAGTAALVDATSSIGSEVTPQGVPLVISKGIVDQLELGRDVFRIDADAFIMENPIHEMMERYPDADIVSEVDCAYQSPKYCGWYRDQVYMERHGGRDPLSEMGFMLNTGFVYIRNNPQTLALARDTQRAVQSGLSTYEQTALNEELVRRNCTWSSDTGPLEGGRHPDVRQHRVFGTCNDGLRVVVLPYATITRNSNEMTGKLAVHPGGTTEGKLAALPAVSRECVSRARARGAAA